MLRQHDRAIDVNRENPMILLRAFPLSLSILWRFLLVLPVWTVFYVVLTVFSLYGAIHVLAYIPVVGFLLLMLFPLMIGAIVYVISMHPYLVGIRIGLNVLGVRTTSSQVGLLGAAVGYGVVEGIAGFALSAIVLGATLIVFQGGLPFDEAIRQALQAEAVRDPVAVLSRQVAFGALTVLSFVTVVAAMALRAALLPVLARAAAGRDSGGRAAVPFGGFGTGFAAMMLVLVAITGLATVAIPLVGDAFAYLGLTGVLTDRLDDVVLFVVGEQEASFTLANALLVAIALVVSIWLFCLQCAGAALNYERRASPAAQRTRAAAVDSHIDVVDPGALRRSRMQNLGT